MVPDYIYPHYWLTKYKYQTKLLFIHRRQIKMDHYKKVFWKRTIKRSLLFLTTLTVLMFGCAPISTFINPDFEQRQIKVIAVMPVVDKRNTAEDTLNARESLEKIEELISKNILEKNYDVVSVSTVKNILNGKEIQNLTPKYLCSTLNVDGILFSELYEYADEFYIDHSLKMHFGIYDAQGDSLWINELDDSNKPFLSAIEASLGWAIGLAATDKVSSENKLPTILAGVAAAELTYVIIDGVTDETSESIDKVFKSFPDRKGTIK